MDEKRLYELARRTRDLIFSLDAAKSLEGKGDFRGAIQQYHEAQGIACEVMCEILNEELIDEAVRRLEDKSFWENESPQEFYKKACDFIEEELKLIRRFDFNDSFISTMENFVLDFANKPPAPPSPEEFKNVLNSVKRYVCIDFPRIINLDKDYKKYKLRKMGRKLFRATTGGTLIALNVFALPVFSPLSAPSIGLGVYILPPIDD